MRGHFGCRQGAMTCRGDRRSPPSGVHHARKSNAADGQKDPQIHKRICETPHQYLDQVKCPVKEVRRSSACASGYAGFMGIPRIPCSGRRNEPKRLQRRLPTRAERPGWFLGRGGRGHSLGQALGPGAGRLAPALLPVVYRRRAQHLLQRPRRARGTGKRRPAGIDLRQPGDGQREGLHLPGAPGRGGDLRRRAPESRRGGGRPGDRLHAHGARGRGGHSGMRPSRRGPLRGVRRLRGQRARHAHRRRPAQGHRERELRHRGQPRRRVQALAGRGRPAGAAQARGLPGAAKASGARVHDGRPGRGLERGGGRRQPGSVRLGGRHRSAVHPLHLRHHGAAQGHRARQRRPRRGAQVEHEERVRRGRGRRVLGRLRRGLGGGPFLYRLRAVAEGLHHRPLRRQARGHAGPGSLLAGHQPAPRQRAVHRAHGLPRHQEGGSRGRVCQEIRPEPFPDPVPGRRALRPRHLVVGSGPAATSRSSTTGGRRRPAGPSRPTAWGSSRCR